MRWGLRRLRTVTTDVSPRVPLDPGPLLPEASNLQPDGRSVAYEFCGVGSRVFRDELEARPRERTSSSVGFQRSSKR
jgi:hypothetical protein